MTRFSKVAGLPTGFGHIKRVEGINTQYLCCSNRVGGLVHWVKVVLGVSNYELLCFVK